MKLKLLVAVCLLGSSISAPTFAGTEGKRPSPGTPEYAEMLCEQQLDYQIDFCNYTFLGAPSNGDQLHAQCISNVRSTFTGCMENALHDDMATLNP